MAPNQALPEGIPLGQADQISRVRINMASKVIVFNNLVGSVYLFRLVQLENYQQRIPIYRKPVR